ncbi:MAG: amidohydrolase family protein [Planctomycetaceae bacterium]|nr:amidohydrolase family protein [Planctomycetaceae bacterium]
MVIDAHQHFWELGRFDTSWLDVPEHAAIHRSFLPGDLKPLLDDVGVTHSVFVQTQHNLEENRWALQLAEENDWLIGVVGWVDLASSACEDQVLEFKEHPSFVGVRHITQGEPDDDFIIRPDVLRGLKVLEKHGVPFDLLFYVKHLHHAQRVARECPGLKLVIDHLSKPHIKDQRLDNWEANLRAAAKFPNMHCKLSGMITEADWKQWKPADLKPYVQIALDAFGPDRLMYGSDWPVCVLAGSYRQVFEALQEALGPISEEEHAHIFERTAREFYGLKVS